ncbi:HD domain-containing protein [Embleya scabrispora]|uniref:HD domain-containing protein n=1 Tax=Embleya scabrispora TaxID=159449 RepID=UPI000477D5C1|nr:HD domain-containing protein [Embleya scabrispora]MYS82759.1 HD domain-containing protein [Streptomyces sp. SID5474]
MADEDRAVANFLFEAGTLKNHKRTGWWIAGIKDPESVAEHSWRAALLASIIAELEGADPAKAALLSVWHDTGETRTGDLAHISQKYVGKGDAVAIAADQSKGLPSGLGALMRSIIGEYEARETPEAICAGDADKLECLVQALEYRDQGHVNVDRWITNSQRRIRTESAKRIASALLETGSLTWLREAMGES